MVSINFLLAFLIRRGRENLVSRRNLHSVFRRRERFWASSQALLLLSLLPGQHTAHGTLSCQHMHRFRPCVQLRDTSVSLTCLWYNLFKVMMSSRYPSSLFSTPKCELPDSSENPVKRWEDDFHRCMAVWPLTCV